MWGMSNFWLLEGLEVTGTSNYVRAGVLLTSFASYLKHFESSRWNVFPLHITAGSQIVYIHRF